MNVTPNSVAAANERQRTGPADAERGIAPKRGRILWDYFLSIWGIHLLACLAFVPWLFSWAGVIVLLAGWVVFGLGVNTAYHRLLTHRGFKAPKWLEYGFVVVALCSLQDTPARWVTHHRYHHLHSDKPKDVHSPFDGFYWAHMGWLFRSNPRVQSAAAVAKFSRDILDDPFYYRLERVWWGKFAVYLAHAVLFFGAGFAAGWGVTGAAAEGLRYGLSILVWGVLVRTVLVWHATWSVNSLCHRVGSRRYATDDDSRNNWFVAAVAGGEGWHHNHHWDQVSARHGHAWWEFDLTWMVIWTLERLGLATDVVRPRQTRRRQASS